MHGRKNFGRGVSLRPSPVRPCLVAQQAITIKEWTVWVAISKPGTAHAHILQQPQVLDLMQAALVVVVASALVVVGLDTTNVVRRAQAQGVDQLINARFDLKASRCGALLVLLGVHLLWKEGTNHRGARHATNFNQVIVECVLVAIHHAIHAVLHGPGIVFHHKRGGRGSKLKVGTLCKLRTEFLMEHLIGARREIANVIQKRKDSNGFLALNEGAHHRIVKELDGSPFDALLHVFLLFLAQCELNKHLL